MQPAVLRALEFDRVVEMVRGFAMTPMGDERLSRLTPSGDRTTAILQRRAERTPPEVQEIAWSAQKRLCQRFRNLMARGKLKNQVCTAIARELVGFIWAIGQHVIPLSRA